MVISANTVWELRTNGTANAGGGFVTGASGTDYSQQDAVHSTRTDIAIDAVTDTDITSVADPFAADDVGNIINITGGTGFTTGRYEVVSVTSGVATLDRAVGTLSSTGGTGILGGAINNFTDAFLEGLEPGNLVYVRDDGTYTLTEAIVVSKSGSSLAYITVEGYNTTRGDGGDSDANRPLISAGANNFEFRNFWSLFHLEVTTTNAEGVVVRTDSNIYNCKIRNTSVLNGRDAIQIDQEHAAILFCEVQSDNGNGIDTAGADRIYGCYIHDCSADGVIGSTGTSISNTIIDTVTDDGLLLGTSCTVINCTVYNCGNGIRSFGLDANFVINTIIDSCTDGIEESASGDSHRYVNVNITNATNETVNVSSNQLINQTTLSPGFADAPNGNFAVGANMKGIGAPSTFPGGLTANNLDLGAAQTPEAGGGADPFSRAGLHPIEGGIAA